MIDGLVIDVSRYDMETWAPECFFATGVRRAIVNVYQPADARVRIESLRAAGIRVVGLYGFVYFGASKFYATRDIDWAIELAQEYRIRDVWVDAEMDAAEIGAQVARSSPAQRVQQLDAALRKLDAAGLRAGVYTAAWWWTEHTGNSTQFSERPLWHARYTESGPIAAPGFGGWTRAEMHQYTSTRELCGRGRDHSYLFVEQEEGAMSMAALESIEARIAELERRTGGNGERARNADLLAYADGLNAAILQMATSVVGGRDGVDLSGVEDAFRRAADEIAAIDRQLRIGQGES